MKPISELFDNHLHQDVSLEKDGQSPILGLSKVQEWFRESPIQNQPFSDISLVDGPAMVYENEFFLLRFRKKGILIDKITCYEKAVSNRRFKAILSYDGRDFHGFQRQSHHPTVQKSLEEAISQINGYLTPVSGASRTDEGVHALHQVIHFDSVLPVKADRFVMMMNYQLPQSISVSSVEEVSTSFHARYHVKRKTYEYHLYTGMYNPLLAHYAWFVKDLDINHLKELLQVFVGTHDFTSFTTPSEKDPIRTIQSIQVSKRESQVIVQFTAKGFLHHMIRLMMGTVIRILQGQIKTSIPDLFAQKSRKETTFMAPPGGLYLVDVQYE